MTPILIAELGSSPAPEWNFNLWCAIAKRSGATHVKVQLFRAEHFPAAERPAKRALEFPRERLREFVAAAHAHGLQAGASAFDIGAIDQIVSECDFLKLACREMNNAELITHALRYYPRIPIYRSIDDLSFASSLEHLVTLFAIQKYPAPLMESVFRVVLMARCAVRADCPWGWSSHTTGDLDVRLAVKLGASVIEKHFCLSPADLEGGHSLTPIRFRKMAERITT
jgi:sialic acid synthase SpsE